MSGFREAGIDVELLCRKNYPLEKKASDNGFTTRSFANIFGALFFLIFKGRRYDVLHAQSSHILTYAILSKPFHRAKIIFTRRVDFIPHGKMTLLKYKLTDQVVAISIAIKRILTTFGAPDVRLISSAIIAKPLDRQRAKKILADAGIPPDVHLIGTTAALVQHKDPLTMVEAIRELAATRRDFVFLHFGKGELEEQMREKIAEYGIEDVYKLMGFYENVEDIFSMLDIFAMSSEQEGLGSSVLDAFMYRVPVVSTDAGGLSDLVDGGRAISCEVKRPDRLAEGMRILLDRTDVREGLVKRAYAYTVERHSLPFITREYLQLLREMGESVEITELGMVSAKMQPSRV
jgi:glycosyltransferase involved in cell wall biosynthesis